MFKLLFFQAFNNAENYTNPKVKLRKEKKKKDNERHELLKLELKNTRFELRVLILSYNSFIDYKNS